MKFDYKLATPEELVQFILDSPVSRITQQLMYYRSKNNTQMVEKITLARMEAKKRQLQAKIDALI